MEAARKGDHKKKVELEISWITDETGGRHEYIPDELLSQVTQEAIQFAEEQA